MYVLFPFWGFYFSPLKHVMKLKFGHDVPLEGINTGQVINNVT